MDAKPEHNAAPRVINGRINGRFASGHSGNPGGSPEATRRAFNKRCAFSGCRFHADKLCLRVADCLAYTPFLHSQIETLREQPARRGQLSLRRAAAMTAGPATTGSSIGPTPAF